MTPHSVYSDRLSERQALVAHLAARIDRLGQFRLLVFGLGVATALTGFLSGLFSGWWALAVLVPFGALVIRSRLLGDRRARVQRAVRYYQDGLGGWPGHGPVAGRRAMASPTPCICMRPIWTCSATGRCSSVCSARTADGSASWPAG